MKERIDDLKIVNELRDDSSNGTKLLFEKYKKALKNYGTANLSLSKEDSEELASDTLIKVYESIYSFNFKGNNTFRNWIYKIFKKKVLDYVGKKGLDLIHFNENDTSENEIFTEADKGYIEVIDKIMSEFTSSGIKEDDRKIIIYETMNEFSPEEQSDLYAYLNGIGHKVSAIYRKMNYDAYRQRISRIVKNFFNKIGEKLNKDGKLIYEKFKENNK